MTRGRVRLLHLNFTQYKFPLATAPGAIDIDVVVQEALISVFDRSSWVAELKLLQTLSYEQLRRLDGCECEDRGGIRELGRLLTQKMGDELKSIGSWYEL